MMYLVTYVKAGRDKRLPRQVPASSIEHARTIQKELRAREGVNQVQLWSLTK